LALTGSLSEDEEDDEEEDEPELSLESLSESDDPLEDDSLTAFFFAFSTSNYIVAILNYKFFRYFT